MRFHISKLGKILINSKESNNLMNTIRNLIKTGKSNIVYLSEETIIRINKLRS